MTEPDPNEPPLVTRPPEVPDPVPTAPQPQGGFWGAVAACSEFVAAAAWCVVFVLAQLFGALVAVSLVFVVNTLRAPDAKVFVDEQLGGFSQALDRNATGDRPAIPAEFGEALAWGMLAAQFVSFGLIVVVFPRRIGPDWKRQLGVRWPSWLHVALVLLMVPGFLIISGAVQEFCTWATGWKPPPAVRALNDVFRNFPWPLTTLAVAIGPGVVEELWCRGFIGRKLSKRYGLVAGVLMTSVLFAAMHADPSQLCVIAVMGAYLHFVYLAARSIWVPIMLHAMNNGISILLALSLKSEQLESDAELPVIVPLTALALMVFGSVALWTNRAELQPIPGTDPDRKGNWEPEYPGISAPPPGAGVRLGTAVVSPVAFVFTIVSFGMLIYLGCRYLI